MTDFLKEVEQELQQENIVKIIKKYLPYCLLAVLLIIVFTAGYVWYDYHKITAQEKISNQYFEAISKIGDTEQAQKMFKEVLANDNKYNYVAMAKLYLASLHLQKNNIKDALILYENIVNNKSYDIIFRDLANLIRISYIYSDSKNSKDFSQLLGDLEQLALQTRPWKYNAMELKASILLDQNQMVEAKEILQKLAFNREVPDSISKNAQLLLSLNWED